MQPRINIQISHNTAVTVNCPAEMTDAELVILLANAVEDLRWRVLRDAETHFVKPEKQ